MVGNVNTFKETKKTKQKVDNRLSKFNYKFDVYGDTWKLDANKSLNFKLLASLNLTKKFENNFRLALANYASEFSSSYVQYIYFYASKFFATGIKNKINETHITNYKALLSKSTEYHLGAIRAFLLDWHDREIEGIDIKVINLLLELKLSGNEKGKAVALGCCSGTVILAT